MFASHILQLEIAQLTQDVAEVDELVYKYVP